MILQKLTFYLFGLCLLMLSGQLMAEPLRVDGPRFGIIDLAHKVEALARPEEAWGTGLAPKPPEEAFAPVLEAKLGQLETGVAWIRITVENLSKEPVEARLFISNFLLHAQLYVAKEGQWFLLAEGSASTREAYEETGFFTSDLELQPGINTFYLRSMKTFPRKAYGIRLSDPMAAKSIFVRDFVFRMAILGFYGAIFAFVFSLWFQFRDPSFTYYLFYVLSIILYFFLFSGTFRQFFFVPWISLHLEEWINVFGFVTSTWFANLFAIEYLDMKTQAPKLRKIYLWSLLFVYGLVAVLYMFVSKGVAFLGINFFGLINIPMLLGPGIYMAWKGYRNARFYILGWGLLGLGLIGFALTLVHILPEFSIMRWAPSVGAALEMLVLCVALTDSFRQREREQLVRIEALNVSLEDSNQQLQQSLRELRLETASRISMVKDLAHRGNNPLHASTLALDEMRYENQQVKDVLWELLGGLAESDAEARECLQNFNNSFEHLELLQGKIRKGLGRMADAIREVRILSGVDGLYREYFSFEEMIPEVLSRLEDELGTAALKRLQWINHKLFDVRLLSHPVVFTVSLERILRFLVVHSLSTIFVEDSYLEVGSKQIKFELSWTWTADEKFPRDELDSLITELSHSLRTYGVTVALIPESNSCRFVNTL